MKHTKKLLALLLAFALILGLALPAMAIKQNDITITGPTEPVPFGETFTLSVDVNLPAGTEIVSYQWWFSSGSSKRIDGATDSILQVAPGEPTYPKASKPYWSAYSSYDCAVSFVEKDAEGNVLNTRTIYSRSFRITVTRERKMNFRENIENSFTDGLHMVAMSSVMTAYVLLPFFPVTFLFGFFFGFFHRLFD